MLDYALNSARMNIDDRSAPRLLVFQALRGIRLNLGGKLRALFAYGKSNAKRDQLPDSVTR